MSYQSLRIWLYSEKALKQETKQQKVFRNKTRVGTKKPSSQKNASNDL